MAIPKIDKLSLNDLKKLQTAVANAIASHEKEQRKKALEAVRQKAKQMGFSLEELTGTTKKSKSAKTPAKYAHPENPSLTWSGRGRQPAWVKDALASGKSLDEYLIK